MFSVVTQAQRSPGRCDPLSHAHRSGHHPFCSPRHDASDPNALMREESTARPSWERMGSLGARRNGYICWRWSVVGPPDRKSQGQDEVVVLTFTPGGIKVMRRIDTDFNPYIRHFVQKYSSIWQSVHYSQLLALCN